MKKNLLFAMVLLAMAGTMKAQDVYSGGCVHNTGTWIPCVYKNGTVLYQENDGYTYDSYSLMTVDPETSDVYWYSARQNSSNQYDRVCIWKNDEIYANLPFTADASPDIEYMRFQRFQDNTAVLATGNTEVDGLWVAALWKNGELLLTPTLSSGIESMARDVVVKGEKEDECDYYICGEIYGSDYSQIVLWRNNELLYQLTGQDSYSYATQICQYNSTIYTLGYENNPETNCKHAVVWMDDYPLYIMEQDNYNVIPCFLDLEAGDVWVATYSVEHGWAKDNDMYFRIWKNGDVVYTTILPGSHNLYGFDVTTDGVYYTIDNITYKNGSLLFTNEGAFDFLSMGVVESCKDEDIRTLPYEEGFEMGYTDWECLTLIDEGHNTLIPEDEDYVYDPQTYWKRYGLVDWGPEKDAVIVPPQGVFCANHQPNYYFEQDDWLISPQIHIDANVGDVTLDFSTLHINPEYCIYDGVLISTTGTNPDDFTEVWHQTEATNDWHSIFLDISEYKGNDIYVAFRYNGLDGDRWFIDAVRILAEDAPSGISENSDSALSVYPNPANDMIRIENGSDDAIEIYNATGQLMMSVEANNGNISVSGLPAGLYLLKQGKNITQFIKN